MSRTPTPDEMVAHLACDGDLRAQIAASAVPGREANVLRAMAESLRPYFRVADDGAIEPVQRTFLDFYQGDFGQFTSVTDKE